MDPIDHLERVQGQILKVTNQVISVMCHHPQFETIFVSYYKSDWQEPVPWNDCHRDLVAILDVDWSEENRGWVGSKLVIAPQEIQSSYTENGIKRAKKAFPQNNNVEGGSSADTRNSRSSSKKKKKQRRASKPIDLAKIIEVPEDREKSVERIDTKTQCSPALVESPNYAGDQGVELSGEESITTIIDSYLESPNHDDGKISSEEFSGELNYLGLEETERNMETDSPRCAHDEMFPYHGDLEMKENGLDEASEMARDSNQWEIHSDLEQKDQLESSKQCLNVEELDSIVDITQNHSGSGDCLNHQILRKTDNDSVMETDEFLVEDASNLEDKSTFEVQQELQNSFGFETYFDSDKFSVVKAALEEQDLNSETYTGFQTVLGALKLQLEEELNLKASKSSEGFSEDPTDNQTSENPLSTDSTPEGSKEESNVSETRLAQVLDLFVAINQKTNSDN